MDNRCEDCYFHIGEDLPGEDNIGIGRDCPGEDNIDSLGCFQSIEDMDKGNPYEDA